MNFTPTFKGAFIAGVGVWLLAWMSVFKLDQIPLLNKFLSKDKILDWVNNHKTLTILSTEVLNFGVHGISNPDSIAVALGGTAINTITIFGIVPILQRKQDKAEGERMLRQGIA